MMERLFTDEQFAEYCRLSIAYNHWYSEFENVLKSVIKNHFDRQMPYIKTVYRINELKAYDAFVSGFPATGWDLRNEITFVEFGLVMEGSLADTFNYLSLQELIKTINEFRP